MSTDSSIAKTFGGGGALVDDPAVMRLAPTAIGMTSVFVNQPLPNLPRKL